MKLTLFFKKLFTLGEILEKTTSPINGEIKVVDDLFGDRSMIIGGISQSGYLVEKLWSKGLEEISNFKFQISNCLILGLGCGNAAKIVAEQYPRCKIRGIEIDPKVIQMGKKYFKMSEIPNLKIIVGDGIEEVRNAQYEIHKTQDTRRKTQDVIRNTQYEV